MFVSRVSRDRYAAHYLMDCIPTMYHLHRWRKFHDEIGDVRISVLCIVRIVVRSTRLITCCYLNVYIIILKLLKTSYITLNICTKAPSPSGSPFSPPPPPPLPLIIITKFIIILSFLSLSPKHSHHPQSFSESIRSFFERRFFKRLSYCVTLIASSRKPS